jgi:hypothetical protein
LYRNKAIGHDIHHCRNAGQAGLTIAGALEAGKNPKLKLDTLSPSEKPLS